MSASRVTVIMVFAATVLGGLCGVAIDSPAGLILFCLLSAVAVNSALATWLLPVNMRNRVIGSAVVLSIWYTIVGQILVMVIKQSYSLSYFRTALLLSGHSG